MERISNPPYAGSSPVGDARISMVSMALRPVGEGTPGLVNQTPCLCRMEDIGSNPIVSTETAISRVCSKIGECPRLIIRRYVGSSPTRPTNQFCAEIWVRIPLAADVSGLGRFV